MKLHSCEATRGIDQKSDRRLSHGAKRRNRPYVRRTGLRRASCMRRLISGGARSSAAFTATRSRVLTGCTPWRPVFCRTSYACSSVRDTEFQGRVYAVSDIHTDYPENLTWAKRQLHIDHRQDVLIVAGDVSHDLGLFQQTLSLLRDAYSQVFFTFGNHELWTRHRQQGTSLISQ